MGDPVNQERRVSLRLGSLIACPPKKLGTKSNRSEFSQDLSGARLVVGIFATSAERYPFTNGHRASAAVIIAPKTRTEML